MKQYVIRKRLTVAALATGMSLCVCGLTACRSLKEDVPAKGNVTLKINARYNREIYSRVKRVYVYPPLKMNEQGDVLEKLSHTQDENGHLKWPAPSEKAEEIRTFIELKLAERGLEVVSFQEILDSTEDYSVLIFNPHYTPVLVKDESKRVQVLFVRLSAVLLPKELDVQRKQERISQEAYARFNLHDDVDAALKTTFSQLIDRIGENGQWVETCPILE